MAAPDTAAPARATVAERDGRVEVGGRLDFTTAREVLGRVAGTIERAPSTTVDLAGVTGANSAGLALLVEWLGVARRAGHEVRFAHVPEGLRQLARVCQVDALLASASEPAPAPA